MQRYTYFHNFQYLCIKIQQSEIKITHKTMKRNLLAVAAMALMACPLFMNCSNDPDTDSVPPSFKEVVIEPATPSMGDTVTATVKFLNEGKKWYLQLDAQPFWTAFRLLYQQRRDAGWRARAHLPIRSARHLGHLHPDHAHGLCAGIHPLPWRHPVGQHHHSERQHNLPRN